MNAGGIAALILGVAILGAIALAVLYEVKKQKDQGPVVEEEEGIEPSPIDEPVDPYYAEPMKGHRRELCWDRDGGCTCPCNFCKQMRFDFQDGT